MKTIKKLVLACMLCLLSATACKKPVKDTPALVEGEWHLESVSSGILDNEEFPIDIYVAFSKSSFEIFQNLGGGHYAHFSGTFISGGNVLSGTYSDGSQWASRYEVTVENDVLTMTAMDAAGGETCTYSRCTIPDSVRKDAEDYSSGTKASRMQFRRAL